MRLFAKSALKQVRASSSLVFMSAVLLR